MQRTHNSSSGATCDLDLPLGFRADDVMRFHGRDTLQIAEQVDAHSLRKGITWNSEPACLDIHFDKQRAHAWLYVDCAQSKVTSTTLKHFVERLLGLTQPVAEFERHYQKHPRLGMLIKQNAGLRVPQAATPFEALSWAITGQQISVNAAVSVRRRLIEAAGLKHSSGIACYPDAARVAGLNESALRASGLSATKAQTLLTLSRMVAGGELPLDAWLEAPPTVEISERLTAVRGIGPWTVNYALLRGFGYLNGSLHGDVAVRRGLQTLLDRPQKVSADEAEKWLAQFSPWRALVAAHLWAMPSRDSD